MAARLSATLYARVKPETMQALEELKALTGKPINRLVNDALEEYVTRQGKAEAA